MIRAILNYQFSRTQRRDLDVTPFLIDTKTVSISDSLNIIQGSFGTGFSSKLGIVLSNETGEFSLGNAYIPNVLKELSLSYYNDETLIFTGVCINIKEDLKKLSTNLIFEDLRTKYKDLTVDIEVGDTWFDCMAAVYKSANFSQRQLVENIYNQNLTLNTIELLLLTLDDLPFYKDEEVNKITIGDVINRCFEIGIYVSGDLQQIIFLGLIFWNNNYTNIKELQSVIDFKTTSLVRNRDWNYLYFQDDDNFTEYENITLPSGVEQSATTGILLTNFLANGIIKKDVKAYFNTTFASLLMLCGLKNRRIYSVYLKIDNYVLGSIWKLNIGSSTGKIPTDDSEWKAYQQRNNSVKIQGNFLLYAKKYDFKKERFLINFMEIG